jgi:hypothetical protein
VATLIGIVIGETALTLATGFAALIELVSIGSLFMSQEIDIGENSPSYAFGPLQNTKTQKLPIPIIYGGPVKVAGNVFYERFLDAQKTRVYRYIGISEGPVESIYDVYANEFNLQSGKSLITDCSASVYTNTTNTTRDSRDPSGRRPYPNDLAFVAVTLKAQENLSGNPIITSMVKGMKVWTPSGTKFSRNPAWIIRDFLTNTRYGLGIPTAKLDHASFLAAVNQCL